MEIQNLEIKTALQIQKPANEVFEAIVDPLKMSNYFLSSGTGRLEEGAVIVWRFPEFDMDVPVKVVKIIKDKYISYHWDHDNKELIVEMELSTAENNSTIVRVSEKGMQNDGAGIKWLMGNTEGWANFLACLKAYLEYGINLRKGAFDFLKK